MNADLCSNLLRYFQGTGVFHDVGLLNLSKNYNWPQRGVFPDITRITGKEFKTEHDNYQNNIRLKRLSSSLWKEFGGVELATWIISDWGGIRGNKERTLSGYVDRITSGDIPMELKGVASYSKILSFMDPEIYAIYDARVAISLNALQLLLDPSDGLAFRYLPGRNKALQKFRDDPSTSYAALTARGWQKLERDQTYETYLQVLRAVSSNINDVPLYQLEMSLFADAERLADLYLTKFNS